MVLLPAARRAARRLARRAGLVFRLRRQYARPRLSREAPHAAGRAAHRTHPWLPPALQPRRPAAGPGGTGQFVPGCGSRGMGRALQAHPPRSPPPRFDRGRSGRGYRRQWFVAEDSDGRPVSAVAYIARGKETDGNPSLRYLTLLRQGARANGLPGYWLQFLDGVKHVDV